MIREVTVGLGTFGLYLGKKVYLAEAVPNPLGIDVDQVTTVGILICYAIYVSTKVIPRLYADASAKTESAMQRSAEALQMCRDMVVQHSDRADKLVDTFRQEMQLERQSHRAEVDGLREEFRKP